MGMEKDSAVNGLEKKLSPGIKKSGLPTFPDYTEEIKTFIAKDEKKSMLPFLNQEKAFLQVARALDSDYPYVLLTGASGIGKSLILDYTLDILTGKIPLDHLKELAPEAYRSFSNAIERHKDAYDKNIVFFPDMFNLDLVEAIPYNNRLDMRSDLMGAQECAESVCEYLDKYIITSRASIISEHLEDEVQHFVISQGSRFYLDMYSKLNSIVTSQPEVKNKICLIPEIEYVSEESYNCTLSLEVEVEDGIEIDYSKFKHDDITFENDKDKFKEDLGQSVRDDFSVFLSKLSYSLNYMRISDTDKYGDNLLDYATGLLSQYEDLIQENNEMILEEEGEFVLQTELFRAVNRHQTSFALNPSVDKGTVDHIVENLDEIISLYEGRIKNKELIRRLKTLPQFLKKNPHYVEDGLMNGIAAFDKVQRQEASLVSTIKDKETADFDKIVSADMFKFFFIHDNKYFPIQALYAGKSFVLNNDADMITWTKIPDSREESTFMTFTDIKEGVYSPCLQVEQLGPFFKGMVLLFKDSFKDFVKDISVSTPYTVSRRDMFLEFLQTKKLNFEKDSVKYSIDTPRIILACDNQDPFIQAKEHDYFDDKALRNRFQIVPVSHVADNTPSIREAMYSLFFKTLDNYNDRNKAHVSFDPESINMVVQSMILNEHYSSLEYRAFVKSIESICSHASAKDVSDVNPDFLKLRFKENLPTGIFLYTNSEKRLGGYFDFEEKAAGAVNGLYVAEGDRSGIVRIESSLIDGLQKESTQEHFDLVDIGSEMVDETAYKGYQLAKDFIRMKLSEFDLTEMIRDIDYDWILRTNFANVWDGIEGNSATTAITVSMISALAKEPVYNNRFVTGSLNSFDGTIKAIGGVYEKGLTPYRLKQLAENDREMYYLFPAENIVDLTKESLFDPFELEKNITCLPVRNIPQAYYLMTNAPIISGDDWENSMKYGKEKFEDTFSNRINNYFKDIDPSIFRKIGKLFRK